MIVVHLTSSRFFGGPERQMLGLASALRPDVLSILASFSEGGLSSSFLDRASDEGFEALALRHDTPHFAAAIREIANLLQAGNAKILCCHGYKAILLGRVAARRAGVPAVAVSRGWTYENTKVRGYEFLERVSLRWMDRVICVSAGQAAKVRRAGVPDERVQVIPNGIRTERFENPRPDYRTRLHEFFAAPVRRVVGAAGRLSPEKGFSVLVDAAESVVSRDPSIGFVLFGEGPLRESLTHAIARRGLAGRFVLAGFRADLDAFVPHFDLMVLPSFTEGMPNVVLEAFASGVPVVASDVGGIPELVEDGASGRLVQPGDPGALSKAILEVLDPEETRTAMGRRGRERVSACFTFEAQAEAYRRMFREVLARQSHRGRAALQPTSAVGADA
jgi:glycosyltransferase involved in cell wall biosynthesis